MISVYSACVYAYVCCVCVKIKALGCHTFKELFNFDHGGSTAMDVYTDDERRLEDEGEIRRVKTFG